MEKIKENSGSFKTLNVTTHLISVDRKGNKK